MADVTVTICRRVSDNKLIAVDANCSDVELDTCRNATTGALMVYHVDCDGQGPEPLNDGWFTVCRKADGGLQITIPDNCCGCADANCSSGSPAAQYRLLGSDFDATVTVQGYDPCVWAGSVDCDCYDDCLSYLIAYHDPNFRWIAGVEYTTVEGASFWNRRVFKEIVSLVCDGTTNVTWTRQKMDFPGYCGSYWHSDGTEVGSIIKL